MIITVRKTRMNTDIDCCVSISNAGGMTAKSDQK